MLEWLASIDAAATRPAAWMGVLLLSGSLLWNGAQAVQALRTRRWRSAWRASLQLVGWAPAAGNAAALALFVWWATAGEIPGALPELTPARVVATIAPLTAACHAAFLLSPSDEKPLETLLTCPRPIGWALLERLGVVFLLHGSAALGGGLLARGLSGSPSIPMFAWVPPMFFLIGAATATSLATRQAAFGMSLTILLWFGMAFVGNGLLARWPVLWPIHIYLQPGALPTDDFALNQAFVSLSGAGMVVLAATRLVRDEEKLLFGKTK